MKVWSYMLNPFGFICDKTRLIFKLYLVLRLIKFGIDFIFTINSISFFFLFNFARPDI